MSTPYTLNNNVPMFTKQWYIRNFFKNAIRALKLMAHNRQYVNLAFSFVKRGMGLGCMRQDQGPGYPRVTFGVRGVACVREREVAPAPAPVQFSTKLDSPLSSTPKPAARDRFNESLALRYLHLRIRRVASDYRFYVTCHLQPDPEMSAWLRQYHADLIKEYDDISSEYIEHWCDERRSVCPNS